MKKFKNLLESDIQLYGISINSPQHSGKIKWKRTGYDSHINTGFAINACNQIVKEAVNWDKDENPLHKGDDFINDSIDHIKEEYKKNKNDRINESDYEFIYSKGIDRLRRRKSMNKKRYEKAQERNDSFYIQFYRIRMDIDDLDTKRIELQRKIAELKNKFNK